MDPVPRKFPFATSFQFRDDERAGFEALFLRAFFDRPFSADARLALERTSFARAAGTAGTGLLPGLSAAAGPTPPASGPGAPPQDDTSRHVLLYRGADGIGKTRVFRLFREGARDLRIPTYEVYHHDVEGIPFKPFVLAIREILRDHDQGAQLQEKYAYGLRSVVPELYASLPNASGSADVGTDDPRASRAEPAPDLPAGEADKVRILDAITQLLLEVTAQKPLLILVHDLHWSDRPTLELLDYIGRNLQLRTAQSAALQARPGHAEAAFAETATGPELDEDFEGEEWRALGGVGSQALEILGVQYYAFPLSRSRNDGVEGRAEPGESAAPQKAPAEAGEERSAPGTLPRQSTPPRLMIVANYRQFADPSHYLEQAIRQLGEQPYSYHGELRPLTRPEADIFVHKCREGVEIDGRPVAVSAELIDAIYEATEGFPSFMQEILRVLYLRECAGEGAPAGQDLWMAAAIRAALATAALPVATRTSREQAAGEAQPAGRRHAILRLRLANSSREEHRVLEVLAVARRPVSPDLIARILQGAQSRDDSLAAIERLRARGIVEGAEPADDHCFFRLWDYTMVVEEAVPEEDWRRLHQLVGEESRAGLGGAGDEAAYEVYYHLRRGLTPRASIDYGLQAARRFARSFALVKARGVHEDIISLLDEKEDLALKLELLEQAARMSLGLKEYAAAEEALRRIQAEGAALLGPEKRVQLLLLEAEAARGTDPGRGLKILGKAPKLLKDDSSRLGVQLQLATARLRLESQDLKRAINFALNGASICQKIGDVPELGELYRVMASAFYRKGDYAHAVDNYQRALDAFERVGAKWASVGALDDLGRVYLERGNHFRAARFLYKSLEIRRRHQDLPGLCRSYDELGRVYLRSGDYLKTIENLNRSLALKERIGDLAGLNPTLMILGDLYFRLGRYEQSLGFFGRIVQNSQKMGETRALVEAFGQLGRTYFELGDIKQAQTYAKQVSILATEFKLRSQEADGALLEGSLRALARDWPGAEKCLKLAADVHGKHGHRRREISAYLDLAETKFQRELYDEALKHVSRAQIIADEVRALDLQVRALTLKGNIYRFLKGGNLEKAREFFHKALELSQKLSDVQPLFQLYYSLAKLSHSVREFAEAASYYGKAELALKQVGDALSEDRAARYFEDKRRKVFAEDLARFKKEAMGRASGPSVDMRPEGPSAGAAGDRPVGAADYKELLACSLRVHREMNQLHVHERVLLEAVELTGADRGLLLRVQNRQYFPTAFHGFGKSPLQHPDLQAATDLAQEVVRRGRSVLISGGAAPPAAGDKDAFAPQLGGLALRSVLAVPFMTDERIFGAVYLDKPVALGQFVPRSLSLLEMFAQQAAVAFWNRRELETAIREPLTGFYTPSYFVERLREAYRWFNLHGRVFTLLGFYVPSLEDVLGDGKGELAQTLARQIGEVVPSSAAVCWGSPVLCVLLSEADLPLQDEILARVRERLVGSFGDEVTSTVLPASSRFHQGSEIYFELRRRLLPEVCDRRTLNELRAILAKDISLRDAKRILEKHKIEATLRKTGGNITHAARELGIHRPQLSNLLKKYALRRELFEGDLNGEEGETVAEPNDN